ncbi:hypothetical protein NliqN6_2457 [Naganishia liquefaciens]|uniref:Conserved oligomeric Golgi complex subunit 8 n=1 Tax=Naganishia liquefaciens TaxID=104408 RepID=A0A8H3TSX1_9TREE|nr:hypothetical protein NliqN6_2457 [Naganishia liquefaciens]
MDSSSTGTLPELLLETYQQTHPHGPAIDLSDKQSTEYLTRLTGYSLNSLNAEPSRLADEHAFVGRELTSLCIGEYKSFVAVHQCKEQVKGALEEFDASLEELRRAIPELEKECAAFVEETSGIQSERRRAQIVLEHQDKLEDLLDIPQLVDTCVRSGYYHEAMELTAHTRQLVAHYPNVPLVHSISAQVDSIMQLQLSQLVASLREPVKLPILVKSIGFLRKMGSLQEDELRLAFLESRAQRWRDHVKEHVDKERSEPTRYVRRYVDAFRELQYDTVAQYTAIFLDPAPFRLQSNRKTSSDPVGMDEASRMQAVDLIVRYAHHAVSDLLQCITSNIPSISDPSSLASLLTQLGYTALSFSRVGMDFSAYLPEVFENAVLSLTTTGWDKGLNAALDKLRPTSTSQKSTSPSGRSDNEAVFVPGFLVSPEMLQSLTHLEPPQYTAPIHRPPESKTIPPTYLSSFPLLAIFTNTTLTTLNSLRLLAPVALFPSLYSHLLETLANLGQALLDYANRSTGQADPGFGPAPRKRPEGLRRNTSISNRDQLNERTVAKDRHGRRILSAVLDAFAIGCAQFLQMALVEGVYDNQFGSIDRLRQEGTGDVKTKNDRLASVLDSIKEWVTRHAEKTAIKDIQGSKVIKEEEATAGDITMTDGLATEAVSTGETDADPQVAIEPGKHVSESDAEPSVKEATERPAGGADNFTEALANAPESAAQTVREPESLDSPIKAPESPQARAEDIQESMLASSPSHESKTSDSAPGVPEESTSTVQASPEAKVVERVLEVQLAEPTAVVPEDMTKQGMAESSLAEDAIPVQVTDDVQIPMSEAATAEIDNAVPVAIVADSSDQHQAGENGIDSTDGGRSELDELDQLIAAKQAVENQSDNGSEKVQQAKVSDQEPTIKEVPVGSDIPSQPPAAHSEMPAPSPSDVTLHELPKTATTNASTAFDAVIPSEIGIAEIAERRTEEGLSSHHADGAVTAEPIRLQETGNPAFTDISTVSGNPSGMTPPSADEAQQPQPSDEDDLPSGVATPSNEAEAETKENQAVADPATANVATSNSAKSKKKKNKKRGKK